MKQGPSEQSILKQSARDGTPLPQAILNAPELSYGLHLYYTSFFELTSCRSLGQASEGRIWWTAIDQLCVRLNIEGISRDDMFHHIYQLDEAYLTYQSKELKKKMDADAKKTKGKGKLKGKK